MKYITSIPTLNLSPTRDHIFFYELIIFFYHSSPNVEMKPILNFPAAILWFGALDMGGIMPCIGYNDSLSAGNNKHVENQHIQSSGTVYHKEPRFKARSTLELEKTNANGVWKYDEELQERSFTARVLTEE